MSFFDRIQRFMAGRNGYDALCLFSFIIYTILVIVNIFANSLIIYIIEWLILGYIIFRMLSKSTYRRGRENLFLIKILGSIKNFFIRQKNKIRDIKTHRYIKCKKCKAKLRVKRKKGKHNVRCPKCGNIFETNIRI